MFFKNKIIQSVLAVVAVLSFGSTQGTVTFVNARPEANKPVKVTINYRVPYVLEQKVLQDLLAQDLHIGSFGKERAEIATIDKEIAEHRRKTSIEEQEIRQDVLQGRS